MIVPALTTEALWHEVEQVVETSDQRWGQAMFNALRDHDVDGVEQCRGSLWDPFYRIKTKSSLKQWIGRHLVFDSYTGEVLAVRPEAWS